MRKLLFRVLRVLRVLAFGVFFWVWLVPVFCGYVGYVANFGGAHEQQWLDQAIFHLAWLRTDCKDKALVEVLDYTIERYNRIGPFDVSVSRCDVYPLSKDEVLGINNPLVPGLMIDIAVLTDYTLHEGAGILVHEALHDYYPYYGHTHVNAMMDRLEKQYVYLQSNRSRP